MSVNDVIAEKFTQPIQILNFQSLLRSRYQPGIRQRFNRPPIDPVGCAESLSFLVFFMETIHRLLVLMLAIQVIRHVMYDRIEHPVQEDFQHILIINRHCTGKKYRQSGVLI